MLILVLGNNALWKWTIFLTFQRKLLPPFSKDQCKLGRKIIYGEKIRVGISKSQWNLDGLEQRRTNWPNCTVTFSSLKAEAAGFWYLSTKLKNTTSQKTVILTQKLPASSHLRKLDTDGG
jgi:hypothetical protein